MSSQTDLRQRITDEIVAALAAGGLPPWRQPWAGGPAFPANAATGRRYSGVNVILLQMHRLRHGLRSKWWGTFRQWEDLGGRVKKRPADVPPGRWGANIVFCRPVTKQNTDDAGEETEDKFFVMRNYTVFNLDQVDGPFDHLRADSTPPPADEIEHRHGHADAVIEATGADIRHGGDRAFYSPTGDYIQLPHRHQFETAEAYYQTAGHELCHWTEHPSRLNWDRTQPQNSYAMGELIAELGGCYLMGELGLPTGDDLTNHAAYLKSWLAGLRGDARFIFRAAAQASRAVDHVLSYSRTPDEAPEPAEALVA